MGYNVGFKGSEYQREPRWPIEMQVLPDKIRHIEATNKEPEPFYVKSKQIQAEQFIDDNLNEL